jgi:site-specific recombinase XerD
MENTFNTLLKFKEWKSIKNQRASDMYSASVKRFFKHTKKTVLKTTIDDITSYQSYIKHRYSDATCAIEATALRSFFNFTNKRGITTIEVRDITVPRIEEKIPVYVVQGEFKILCDIARYTNPMMHLALNILWFTAVRVSELVDIKVDDIDILGRCAVVRTRKAFRPKHIFWDEETNELIRGVLRAHPNRKYLFQSPTGGQLSKRQVERWVAHLVKLSGLGKHITPHSFRHGATKEWLNNGVDLPAIKDLLGHRSLVSIEKYTRRLDDHIKEKGMEAVRQRVNALRYDPGKLRV